MNAILTTIGILLLASFAQVSSAAHGNERPIKDLSEANSQIHWPKGFDPKEADAFVHNEIWIKAPASVIWGILVNAGAWPAWYSNASDMRIDSPDKKTLEAETAFT